MSYLALARRYRPDDFSKILAQNHITKTLTNAIKSDRISQAYLLCGPRGTGKTSTARVFAKSLNCKEGPTVTPCGVCNNCKEIKAGISPDVFEIDAASNRGIDDIRELRENVRYAPVASTYKIYIVDEVHRLTQEAFDALLKTLEEPPSHVIFIFATTEPQQLPATILSRTQRFDFKRVPVSALAETVNNVARSEELEIEPTAALMIARKADGSLRDALSLLDQIISFASGSITAETTADILGLVKSEFLMNLTSSIIEHNHAAVLEMFSIYFNDGGDIEELATAMSNHLSRLLMIKNGVKDTSMLEMDRIELEKAEKMIEELDTSDLLRMLQLLSEYIVSKKSGIDPVIGMEIALTRMASLDRSVDIEQILSSLKSSGGAVNLPAARTQPKRTLGFHRPKSDEPNEPPDPPESMMAVRDAASAPVQVPSGNHTISEVTDWWPNFLNYTKSKSMALWSLLQQIAVESVEDNNIRLGYNSSQKYVKEMLSKDKKKLRDLLTEFSGNRTAVSFVKTEIKTQAHTVASPQSVSGDSDKLIEMYPEIKKLRDDIDGEILGITRS